MKIRTKAPNFALTKELNEITNKSTKFWLKVWQDWALAREYIYDVDIMSLRSIQFCHADNKQVIMRCCSYNSGLIVLVMFEICQGFDSPRRLVQFWQNFQTSLVLLIPYCTRHRMIDYLYLIIFDAGIN